MEIKQGINKFYYGSEENPLGLLDYKVTYNTLFIGEISVVPHLKGQGVGSDLAEACLNFAKNRGYKVEIKSVKVK